MAALAALAMLASLAVLPGPASARAAQSQLRQSAGGDERPTAVVAMGDSFISGEAGRWFGNTNFGLGDRSGTDRAAYRGRWGFWRYDEGRVYGASGDNGCHRSDVAPLASSEIDADELINLACSGAATVNLLRAGSGGIGLKGEPPQGDALGELAAEYRVEMIVVSVGGNDLGYGSIIVDCALGYVFGSVFDPDYCADEKQANVDDKIDQAMAGVGAVLDDIAATMADAGYRPGDYRLVVQSYPSPIADGERFRYRQSNWGDRLFVGGCPFWDADATWARRSLVGQISDALAFTAASRRAEFLDLQDAFEGREVCADTVGRGSGDDDGNGAEWARYVTVGTGQGELQESLHPNALGQEANGTCLRMLYQSSPGSYRCTNVAGQGPSVMDLTSTTAIAVNN
jgi:hypothetical protein